MPICPKCRGENPELGAKCPRDGYYYIYEEALKDAHKDAWLGKLAADKYVVLSLISKGGMGAVYRAMQLPVQREVAFKVLLAELEDNDKGHDRFAREARAISKLKHPNIITMHDFGVDDDDHPFMVMEYAPGQSLGDWIMQPGLKLDRISHVFRQILSALSEAHNQGVVHRDLKPENLIVTQSGSDEDFIKLLDFGIARMVHDGATQGLTREGEVFGTPHYMAPEQAQGRKDIGPPADVYALGVMLYEMLSGQCPFDAPTPLSILYMHINDDLPKLSGRNGLVIPAALRKVVYKATAKEADDRYADAGEMLEGFDAATGGAQRTGQVTAGSAAVPQTDEPDDEARLEKATANTLMSGEVQEKQGGSAVASPADTGTGPDDAGPAEAGPADARSQPATDPDPSHETTFELERHGADRTKKLISAAALLIVIAVVSGAAVLSLMSDDGETPQQSEATTTGSDEDFDMPQTQQAEVAAPQAEVAAGQPEGGENIEREAAANEGADDSLADSAEKDQDDSPKSGETGSSATTPTADRRDAKPSPKTRPVEAPTPADFNQGSEDDGSSTASNNSVEEAANPGPAPKDEGTAASSDDDSKQDDGPSKFEPTDNAPKKFERKPPSGDDDEPRKWR